MLRSLYRLYLECCAAFGDSEADRRLDEMEHEDMLRQMQEWADLLRLADEVGADRERVCQVILADALGPFYQQAESP